MWVDLGVGVGLRSGRGLILPARGDFARGGLRFLSRRGDGARCGLISAWAWVDLGLPARGDFVTISGNFLLLRVFVKAVLGEFFCGECGSDFRFCDGLVTQIST